MRRGLSFAFLLCAAVVSVRNASAQKTVTLAREDIPHTPTDTLPTDRDDVKIVTFADGTFRFIPANRFHVRSAETYGAHWDTVSLFAYRSIGLADLPESVSLMLVDEPTSAEGDGAEHGSSEGRFRAPATGEVLSKYGRRGRRDHNGTDIRVAHGQPVFAAFDGIVRFSRWNSGGFGNIVIIRHPSGLETYYAHLSRRAVAAGEWVRAGQVIGYGGRTGRATTNHLHFETRYFDQNFDPERVVNFETGELKCETLAIRKSYFSINSRAVEGIEADEDENSAAADSADSTYLASIDTAPAASESTSVGNDGAAQVKAAEPVYHTVVSGDTLLAIARRYGTTTTGICRLNGITRNGILKIGKKLRIK